MATNRYLIHGGSSLPYYKDNPPIYAYVTDRITRPDGGEIVDITIEASLDSMDPVQGWYFGYTLELSASIDSSDVKPLFSKPSSPNRWGPGAYSGSATFSVKTTSSTATLHLYLQSNCKCENNTRREVRSISLQLPAYIKKYKVEYNANGGYGPPSSQEKVENVPLILSSTVPTTSKNYKITYNPNGGSMASTVQYVQCSFSTWNTSSSGSGISYPQGANYTANSDLLLYAIWTNPILSSTLPITPPSSNHYLEGWYIGSTKITESYIVTEDIHLTAHWETIVQYQVSYNTSGGVGGPSTQIKYSNAALQLSSVTPSKLYTVTLDADGGSIEGSTSRNLACTFLYWTKGPTIYYPGNYYTENEDAQLIAQYSNPIAGSLPIPQKSGYTFMGWFDSNGTRVDSSYVVASSMTFTAKWATYIYKHVSTSEWQALLRPKKFNGVSWEEIEVHYNI